ncbi:MAG TPA: hypothetical protein VIG80_08750 [Bacillaceae bacterium]
MNGLTQRTLQRLFRISNEALEPSLCFFLYSKEAAESYDPAEEVNLIGKLDSFGH